MGKLAACATISIFGWLAAGAQTVMLDDPFSDGSRLDGADPQDASWFSYHPDLSQGGSPPFITTANFAPLSGGVLGFSGSSTFAFGVASFASVTLTNPGDSISVAMNFALTGATTASGLYGPVIGLFNHGGTPLTADISSLAAATVDDVGFELIYERGLSGDLFFVPVSNATSAADFAYEVRNPALTWDANAATIANTGHTLQLTLTLGSDGSSLLVTPVLNGYVGAPQLYSGALQTLTFNQVIVSSWSGTTGYIDNVQVTFTAVPEPTTASLLFAGLAGVWLVRRRRANQHNP